MTNIFRVLLVARGFEWREILFKCNILIIQNQIFLWEIQLLLNGLESCPTFFVFSLWEEWPPRLGLLLLLLVELGLTSPFITEAVDIVDEQVLEQGYIIYILGLLFFSILEIWHTLGPRIMWIHLVQNSTSPRYEKNPKIFPWCEFIQLVGSIIHLVLNIH